jgi:hypothetical protein
MKRNLASANKHIENKNIFEQDYNDNKIKQAKLKRDLDFVPIDKIINDSKKLAGINAVNCL